MTSIFSILIWAAIARFVMFFKYKYRPETEKPSSKSRNLRALAWGVGLYIIQIVIEVLHG